MSRQRMTRTEAILHLMDHGLGDFSSNPNEAAIERRNFRALLFPQPSPWVEARLGELQLGLVMGGVPGLEGIFVVVF